MRLRTGLWPWRWSYLWRWPTLVWWVRFQRSRHVSRRRWRQLQAEMQALKASGRPSRMGLRAADGSIALEPIEDYRRRLDEWQARQFDKIG